MSTISKGKFGKLIGAIDEGTSSARFILFKAGTAEIVCWYQKDIQLITPQEGWAEQDPMVILEAVNDCIEKCVENLIELGGFVEDIAAVGITNQRETTIVWDKKSGRPMHDALVWLDMRTASTVDQLLDTVPNKSRNKNYLQPLCGLPLSPYFSAVKLRWLKDNVPDIGRAMRNGTCLFGTVDTWLLWNLTGGPNNIDAAHITDVTNASRTMLMNIEDLRWDPHLLKFFDIPKDILPEIRSSSEIYGLFNAGPLKGVPLSGCLGDQQSALVGQQCLSRGQTKATYGTGCFLLYNTGNVSVTSAHGLLTTVAYQLGSESPAVYALEGSVAIAGAAVSWLKNNMNLIDSYEDIDDVTLSVPDCGDVYFVPAFSGLYAPHWNQEARGVICGLNEDTENGHILRATLEAICFQVRDILEAMAKDCGIPMVRLQVDGGMTINDLMMQMQADLIGLSVLRPAMAEATALGTAMMAGHAVGLWEISKSSTINLNCTEFKSKTTDDERDMRYSKWKMAVERSLGWDISYAATSNNKKF